METSAGVLHRFPSGSGINTNPFHKNPSVSCRCAKPSMLSLSSMAKQELGADLKSRKSMVSGFYDDGCLTYYSSGRGMIRCGKKEKNKEKNVALKQTKKKLKLLKGLSRGLSNLTEMGFGFGSGSDVALVDQVQGKTVSETAELLLGQLQRLKAEEKELKRKRKEEKALMKMKGASQVQGTINCEMSLSSSSSSESSDDECGNLVDMKNLECETLAKTIPEAYDRALENAASLIGSHIIEPPTQTHDITASLEAVFPASDCCISGSNVSTAAVAATTTAMGTKKIEVCMGGKCKRSGAGAILEKFQQVVGIEAAVSGCKCMGKCKVGPNVKVSGCSSSTSNTFQAGDFVSISSPPTSNSSLCIGVGLEDVNMIAANLLGRNHEAGLANAVC